MANCKDCIHYDVCESDSEDVALNLTWANKCQHFKDKADVVPKSEVEMLQAEKDALIKNYAECMKDYAREIFEEIEQEIELALESNYKSKNGQMMSEHITNEEREFIEYVNGKIHALGGISYFIAELKKKYTESEGNI